MNSKLKTHTEHNMFHDYFLTESWTETIATGLMMLLAAGVIVTVFVLLT